METTSVIEDLVQRINDEKSQAHEHVRKGANEAQINDLRSRCQAAFGLEPPEQYLEFLLRSNGLDYNGLVIYDSASSPTARSGGDFWQGLVAANQVWRENAYWKRFLILGDSDMDVFALAIEGLRWLRMDRVAREIVEEYASFDSMVQAAIEERL